MLWLSSYIQNWQMTKIDHLPTKHKLLHFTSSTPTIDVEPKKSFASGIISGLQRIGVYGDTIYGSSCLAANINGCEYKINSFPPQLRKPAWLMDGIKWMQIKMFHKIDD